jgi:hypothetical protein
MRYILATITLGFLSGCTSSPPPGIFDVRSSTDERIIGHCVIDPASVEATAYRERAKELIGARAENSSIPGFRAALVQQPGYQYILYVPATASVPPYHVVCPLSGDRASCTLAGRYEGGTFEAYVSLETVPQVEAAAIAALTACRPMTANNSFKPKPLRGSA